MQRSRTMDVADRAVRQFRWSVEEHGLKTSEAGLDRMARSAQRRFAGRTTALGRFDIQMDAMDRDALAETLFTALSRQAVEAWEQSGSVTLALDDVVLDALLDTADDTPVPANTLTHLPFETFVVAFETPIRFGDSSTALGFAATTYCRLTNAANRLPIGGALSDADEIMLIAVVEHRDASQVQWSKVMIPVGGADSISELVDSAAGSLSEGASISWGRQLVTIAVPVLLYLASSNPDITGPNGEPTPAQVKKHRKFGHPLPPKVFEVGVRIGAVLRQEKNAATPSENSETGRGVIPHPRKGHWHTVKCGPGREQSRMQWYRPIFVNAHRAQDGHPATARPVA